jgi:hypothetical protein
VKADLAVRTFAIFVSLNAEDEPIQWRRKL